MPVIDAKARGQFKSTRESLMRKCNNLFTKYGESVTLFISEGSDIWMYQSRPDFPPENPRGYLFTPANYVTTPRQIRPISTTPALVGEEVLPPTEKQSLAQAGFRLTEEDCEHEDEGLFVQQNDGGVNTFEDSSQPQEDDLSYLFEGSLCSSSSANSRASEVSPRRKHAQPAFSSDRKQSLRMRSPLLGPITKKKKVTNGTGNNKYKFGKK